MIEKIYCPYCKTSHFSDAFYTTKTKRGFSTYCKDATRKIAKQKRAANPEQKRAENEKYRSENKEYFAEKNAAWQKDNKPQRALTVKRYLKNKKVGTK